MARIRTIARRTFLVGSAALAGGVSFGIWTVRRPHDNPLAGRVAEGAATFNPWVVVDAEGVTLLTPHADIGQGAAHMQALLIAEEMDLAPGGYRTVFPEPDAAYYNTALAAEAADALAALVPIPAAFLETAVGAATKVIGLQMTGGSSSVPDSFDKLRRAGAVARETLKAAAAAETGIAVSDLGTADGQVLLPDGTALPYTALAGRAATLDPVTDVPLRPASDWRLIGRAVPRPDVIAKSTGRQEFGIDMALEGMLHAAVRTNPRRGPMLGFDAAPAEAMRGVRKVVPVTNGVAVIADNTWRAFAAVEAVDVVWGEAPYRPEQEQHWQALAESLGSPDALNATWREDGDVDAAPGEVVEATYRAPYVAHQPLEPLNATVRVTEDAVEVWTGTQVPADAARIVAETTGHAPEDVRLHNRFAGGSFGHRLEVAHLRLAAEIADAVRGTPVKLTYSREEDFAQDFPRHIALARCAGRVAEGRVTALDIDVAAAPVTLSQSTRLGIPLGGPDTQTAAGIFNAPYAPQAFRVRGYLAEGLAPVSSWRSVGASYGGFFLEGLLDELIHAAGADPVAERLRLVSDPVARGVLERVAEMADWQGPVSGPGRGRGVALVESFGVPVAEIVEVTATERGIRIDDVWVAADAGPVVDPVNFENQVQGGVIWGLGHAITAEHTYSDGMAEQRNFPDGEGLRLSQAPRVHVAALTANRRIRGIGEPPVPPAAPALAAAIFAATGTRLREMPFRKAIDFV
ncbi:xanthine dehydrogenase family protein molybdopterin-binding subunit [Roseivivax isoporae]|uniref:Isoquinoline 1-oxidoreductase subunit beta n=1 Tax=Roseivivax isoporae LMG 25204 TaxID=1449351 RepID=X7F6X0_9RHOB|nr:molybdopterin cofactor-binding domain-containing protein [Roseivivax isoporae]ETX27856.1 isoquinoline 1-oxidoreductase subunit beta [Roseivivax isoporae LMG 25204]